MTDVKIAVGDIRPIMSGSGVGYRREGKAMLKIRKDRCFMSTTA
jgi:hypothetical protein